MQLKRLRGTPVCGVVLSCYSIVCAYGNRWFTSFVAHLIFYRDTSRNVLTVMTAYPILLMLTSQRPFVPRKFWRIIIVVLLVLRINHKTGN